MEYKQPKSAFEFFKQRSSNNLVIQDQKNHLIRLKHAKSCLRTTFSQASIRKERPSTTQNTRLNKSVIHLSRIN
jgi:hypothetical protein